MFEGIRNSFQLLKNSVAVLRAHPKLLLPLLTTWVLTAAAILPLIYLLDWESYGLEAALLICLGLFFIYTLLLALSASVLLEMIEQIESGQGKPKLIRSLLHTLRYNALKTLPVAFAWAVIWFVLTVIEALLSDEDSKTPYFIERFFEGLNRAVQLVVFLILPAIAWDGLGPLKATKRGVSIIRAHKSTFLSGFALTWIVAAVAFLPVTVLALIFGQSDAEIPIWLLILAAVYSVLAWSFSIYVEQMFTAELYLWNREWEKAVEEAKSKGLPEPCIEDVPRPSLLDDAYALKQNNAPSIYDT